VVSPNNDTLYSQAWLDLSREPIILHIPPIKDRFDVFPIGDFYHDTTYWDPVIRTADGVEHRASRGFSLAKQGESGWYFEMEIEPGGASQTPSLSGLTRDLDRWQTGVGSGASAGVSSDSHLPLGVLTGAAGQSGVAWAVAASGHDWRVVARRGKSGEPGLSGRAVRSKWQAIRPAIPSARRCEVDAPTGSSHRPRPGR